MAGSGKDVAKPPGSLLLAMHPVRVWRLWSTLFREIFFSSIAKYKPLLVETEQYT